VGPDQAAAGAFLRPIEYGLPAYPAPPYGPPDYIAAPEVLSRIGDLLGAINNPDERSRLAKQWLDYCKKVIAQDMEYREQWLDLQKQQLAQQQQQVEQLRLEVARLQAQVDELRARNTQLEQQSFPAQAYLAPTPAGP